VAIVKRVLLGRPLPSAAIEEQRLSKTVALPVFSSDAISSTAYATEEILFVTAVAASSLALALARLVPIAIAVAVLLAIVITSYRQVIFAYPGGGGAYVVSRENLGEMPSLVAAASLMVDYILTVAVSVSAGVAAIVSIPAFHSLRDHRVALGLALVALVTLANLRGVRESGRIFAVPTYLYIVGLAVLIGYGLIQSYTGGVDRIEVDRADFDGALTGGTLGLFIVLKGFSSGAVALTGIEAISNAVPAFRRPEARNAATTLVWMGVILGSLFFGTALLAYRLGPYPTEDQTVIAQLGLEVFGNGPFFLFLQFATAVILVLAANTAYAGFPRLSSIVAQDGYLPRQLASLGDRLVFSNGVLALALAAGGLLVAFGGITNALIPLYAVGVFTSFTLSQAGMVRHHRKERAPGWKRNTVINGVGAAATFGVLGIVAVTKFSSGAWLPLVVIPGFVVLFQSIHRHYASTAADLSIPEDYHRPRMNHTMVVLVGRLHQGVLKALAYAQSLNPNYLVAVNVVGSEDDQERLEKAWAKRNIDVPLEFVYSPYRELTRPLLDYLDELDARYQNDTITVVIPEFVVKHWWGHLLHNQSALLLKGRLLFRRDTVVTSVPYHLQ
jgi:amino acid transporter